MTFVVELPMPPSLNNAFRNVPGKGRVKTDRYAAWHRDAVIAIFAQVRADRRVPGRVCVRIDLPEACRMDIDNAIKPLLDALVASRRIDDDRHVTVLEVGKVRPQATALVEVRAA